LIWTCSSPRKTRRSDLRQLLPPILQNKTGLSHSPVPFEFDRFDPAYWMIVFRFVPLNDFTCQSK